jgi:hypothetical protein
MRNFRQSTIRRQSLLTCDEALLRTRLFQILFRWKRFYLCPPISKDLKRLIVALSCL